MQNASQRRIQAFIRSAYIEQLLKNKYSNEEIEKLITKYIASVTLLSDGTLSCMLCDPCLPYCRFYDMGKDCQCERPCDFTQKYKPSKTFKNVHDYEQHYRRLHSNHATRTNEWFSTKWGNMNEYYQCSIK